MHTTFQFVCFWAFAIVAVASALAVITLKNSVHAVLSLVLTFFSTACIWILLQAEFLGIALVVVYVGAVMV
ncbi:MAG TPA: NADH-quinone oxidoreductase subunit J, partial [Rhodanobacteraceae bacterium]|nr:NADH-quinone oxidoreductase subunit J [Rhodanobacteraceae bacterium]